MWSRSTSVDEALATTYEQLAASLRSGETAHSALRMWFVSAPVQLRSELEELSRRVTLGQPPCVALRAVGRSGNLNGELDRLARILESGARAEVMADEISRAAGVLRRRAAALASARSAAAGARLSGRLVAGLPLAFLLLVPAARAPVWDGVGLGLLVVGASLAVAGMRWIDRLVPAMPTLDDPLETFSRAVAAHLRCGHNVRSAFTLAVGKGIGHPGLIAAARSVALGASWTQALRRDPELQPLARLAARATRLGLGIADELCAYADRRVAERGQRFEIALRRAPVLMVVPLAVCILPAFALLALAPFLRGLIQG